MTKAKVAIRREAGHPMFAPAPMYAVCVCGERIQLESGPAAFHESFGCASCGREYSAGGWLIPQEAGAL